MDSLIKYVEEKYIEKKDFPKLNAGDSVTVYYDITEGAKSRTTYMKGTIIQVRGKGETKTFTLRRMSGDIGVERVFPMNLPAIQRIEVNKRGKVRRKRIFYFRNLQGKKARIKEKNTL